MSWDRDLYLDSFLAVSSLRSQGVPVETRWSSSADATYEGWWLDPKSKEFGPNARYYQHDVAEAKKLLEEVLKQDPKYADGYYQLGKLQLEEGDVKTAITNLEAGSKLSPNSDYIHYQLAMAYRRDAQMEAAAKEMKLYEDLKSKRSRQN